ncbi:MAG: DUF1501 domain-containing protein [Planctomycetota bacterium]|nr:DUF1501 domain-containing protein [Planctomycetota bacterium]
MLTILGQTTRFCDGVSRRTFLKIGGLAMGGIALPDLLRAEQKAGLGRSHKSIIMIYLPGGPPHQDMFDLKLDAPRDIRGEFRPIATAVPGIEICELFPRMARIMDKLVPIRSIVGSEGQHNSFQCMTGRTQRRQPRGGWPEAGAVVDRVLGSVRPGVPSYVNLSPTMKHRPYNSGRPGFLGIAHAPFKPDGEAKANMVLDGISLERLGERENLLASFDRFRRDVDAGGLMSGMDAFQRQAFGMLTSSRLAEALDLSREDPRVRDRYGHGTARIQGDAAPRLTQQFLLARRLVEAGARFVTLSYSFWDWHGGNFSTARRHFPDLDQGVSALVEDLHSRGLDKDVSVVVWGEFGRTPRINKNAGRDHWPKVSCALLAGGGMRTGQVIGSTDRLGQEARDRPVHFEEVFATLYHNLGIDARRTTVPDYNGRPHYLVDHAEPLRELV